MNYIVIPIKTKSESNFFMDLLKKLNKNASSLSTREMEDIAFISALKEAEQSGKGSLPKVKSRLNKVASGR